VVLGGVWCMLFYDYVSGVLLTFVAVAGCSASLMTEFTLFSLVSSACMPASTWSSISLLSSWRGVASSGGAVPGPGPSPWSTWGSSTTSEGGLHVNWLLC
jgi:hypothetical protein